MRTINIGIIGGGNMGNCLVGGLIHHGHSPKNIWLADENASTCAERQKQWGIHTTTVNKEVAKQVEILVLAVKPQSMRAVLQDIAPIIQQQQTLLISIAAGITTSQLQRWGSLADLPIVRAMPNTPALYGKGVTGLFAAKSVTAEQRQLTEQLLQAVGETVWIEEESLMNVVTALSGSGPAYFFYLMEGLISAAQELGLAPEIARKLTLHTALGSATMALNSNDDVATLRAKVTSPGGTTEQGINVLKDGKLKDLLAKTLQAATHRGKTLSEQND